MSFEGIKKQKETSDEILRQEKYLKTSEIFDNHIYSWAFVFSKLRRSEFVFVDKN